MTTPFPSDEGRILFLDLAEAEGPLVRSLIEDNGWIPVPSFSSEDLLQRLHRDRIDLVLLDLGAKSVDCLSIVRELRFSLPATRSLPILAVYPEHQPDLVAPLLEAGADDVIARPIPFPVFGARVRSYLRAKCVHDRLAEVCAELAQERGRLIAAQARIGSRVLPRRDDIRFWTRKVACGQSGGDYVEVLPLKGDRLAIILADVSGHGADATVHASMLRAVLASCLRTEVEPRVALREANEVLLEALGTDDLITCYVGILEPPTGRLTHACAGHGDPWRMGKDSDFAEEVAVAGGAPLGVFESAEFEQSQTLLETGSRFFLFTNGLWQQRDPSGEALGLDRLQGLMGLTSHMGLEEAGEFLLGAVEDYRGETPWEDDALLLILERPLVE